MDTYRKKTGSKEMITPLAMTKNSKLMEEFMLHDVLCGEKHASTSRSASHSGSSSGALWNFNDIIPTRLPKSYGSVPLFRTDVYEMHRWSKLVKGFKFLVI